MTFNQNSCGYGVNCNFWWWVKSKWWWHFSGCKLWYCWQTPKMVVLFIKGKGHGQNATIILVKNYNVEDQGCQCFHVSLLKCTNKILFVHVKSRFKSHMEVFIIMFPYLQLPCQQSRRVWCRCQSPLVWRTRDTLPCGWHPPASWQVRCVHCDWCPQITRHLPPLHSQLESTHIYLLIIHHNETREHTCTSL